MLTILKISGFQESKMANLFRLMAVAAAFMLASCQPGTSVTDQDMGASPVVVTNVAATDLEGTVVYDEVIPFTIGLKDPATGNTDPSNNITGALQSRVIKSKNTGTLIFAYRFRDLVFTYPPTVQPQFIEFVKLDGYDRSFFPLEVFNVDTSQSLGAETWGAISTIAPSGIPNAIYFHWASYFTKPEGTTFVAFLTKATKYKTGKYLFLSPSITGGSHANTEARLDGVAIPAK